MEQSYKLRVTLETDLIREACANLETSYFKRFVRAEEIGKDTGKKHFHYYFSSTHSKPALRQQIQTKIGKGNAVYSMKALKENAPDYYPVEYLSYLMKEDQASVWVNIPDEVVETVQNYANEMVKKIAGIRKGGRLSIIRDDLIKISHGHTLSQICSQPNTLVEGITKIYLEQGWLMNRYKIADTAQTLLCEYNEKYRARFVSSVLDLVEK